MSLPWFGKEMDLHFRKEGWNGVIKSIKSLCNRMDLIYNKLDEIDDLKDYNKDDPKISEHMQQIISLVKGFPNRYYHDIARYIFEYIVPFEVPQLNPAILSLAGKK